MTNKWFEKPMLIFVLTQRIISDPQWHWEMNMLGSENGTSLLGDIRRLGFGRTER